MRKAADLTTAIQQCCRKCPVTWVRCLKHIFLNFFCCFRKTVCTARKWAYSEHLASHMSEVLCFPKHQHYYPRYSSWIVMMPSVADCYYISVHLKKYPDVQPRVYNTHQDYRCNNWIQWENVERKNLECLIKYVNIGIFPFQTCYDPVVLVWKWPNLHSLLDALGGSRIIFGVQVSQEQRVDERRLPKPWFA